MIRTVLFDLDGTLLNRDESVKRFINNQYERFNNCLTDIPKEMYTARFIELDDRGNVWKDKVYKQIVDEFSISGLGWEDLLEDYVSEFKHHCVPFSNLLSTLRDLKRKNLTMGVITNGKGQFQMDNIKALGIERYLDTILISDWEGIKKPNAEIFNRALIQLNVAPNESVFVGDHPINDVLACKEVGMKSIWKKDRQWDSVDADYTIDDLSEIPTIIHKLNKEIISYN